MGHVRVLLDKLGTSQERDWYAAAASEKRWSRDVLVHQVETRLLERAGSRELLDRLDDAPTREWYAARGATEGWSRAVLETMIAARLHERHAAGPSNFPATLPAGESDLAQEITRDPYVFDFVRLAPGYRERELQAALLAELRWLLLELGTGFAIVGEQYPLVVGGSEFFVDLLCYHTRLHRYVALELKLGRFEPRDLGQLQFYVQAVDG